MIFHRGDSIPVLLSSYEGVRVAKWLHWQICREFKRRRSITARPKPIDRRPRQNERDAVDLEQPYTSRNLEPEQILKHMKAFVKIHDLYHFAADHNLEEEAQKIKHMKVHPEAQAPRVRKAYLLDLFEEHKLLDDCLKQYWPEGLTEEGKKKREVYRTQQKIHERLTGGGWGGDGTDEEGESLAEQAFALEADLRDFLAHNLHTIEAGLKLYKYGDKSGVEFAIEGGRVDILALDKADKPVVIELKLSQGRNRTIGQLLFYMGWIDKNLGKGQSRGMIIARKISPELILATQRVSGVELYQYSVAVSVQRVADEQREKGKAVLKQP